MVESAWTHRRDLQQMDELARVVASVGKAAAGKKPDTLAIEPRIDPLHAGGDWMRREDRDFARGCQHDEALYHPCQGEIAQSQLAERSGLAEEHGLEDKPDSWPMIAQAPPRQPSAGNDRRAPFFKP